MHYLLHWKWICLQVFWHSFPERIWFNGNNRSLFFSDFVFSFLIFTSSLSIQIFSAFWNIETLEDYEETFSSFSLKYFLTYGNPTRTATVFPSSRIFFITSVVFVTTIRIFNKFRSHLLSPISNTVLRLFPHFFF